MGFRTAASVRAQRAAAAAAAGSRGPAGKKMPLRRTISRKASHSDRRKRGGSFQLRPRRGSFTLADVSKKAGRPRAGSRGSDGGGDGSEGGSTDSDGDLFEERSSAAAQAAAAAGAAPGSKKAARAGSKRKKKAPSLEEIFDLIDIDGDGELTKDEVLASAAALGMTPEEAAALFDRLDVDKSGTLTRDEFRATGFVADVASGLSGLASDALLGVVGLSVGAAAATAGTEASRRRSLVLDEMFDKIDLNGDGELSKDEVVAAAAALKMTPAEAAALFDRLDVDKSGTLSRDEFASATFGEDVLLGFRELSAGLSELLTASAFVAGRAAASSSRQKSPAAVPGKEEEEDAEAKAKLPTVEELFDLIDLDGDGELTKDEVVASAAALKMAPAEAAALFDRLDVDKSGTLTRDEFGATGFAKGVLSSFTDLSSMLGAAGFASSPPAPQSSSSASASASPASPKLWPHSRGALRRPVVKATSEKTPAGPAAPPVPPAAAVSPPGSTPGSPAGSRSASRRQLRPPPPKKTPTSAPPKEQPPPPTPDKQRSDKAAPKKAFSLDGVFELIDLDGDGTLTREEVVAAAGALNMTPAEAEGLFDELDVDRSGTLTRDEFKNAKLADDVVAGFSNLADGLSGFLGSSGFSSATPAPAAASPSAVAAASLPLETPAAEEAPRSTSRRTRPPPPKDRLKSRDKSIKKVPTLDELFDLIDLDGDGELSKEEVVAAASALDVTPEEAAELFDRLDVDKSGTLTRREFSSVNFAADAAANFFSAGFEALGSGTSKPNTGTRV